MFLTKRSNKVYYVVYGSAEKRKYVSTGTKKKKEADDFLKVFREMQTERESLNYIPIALKDFLWKFLLYAEPTHTDSTIRNYKTTFKFVKLFFGNIQLSEITTLKLQEYFQKRYKDSSIFAVRKDHINLSSAFSWAVDQKYLLENPCRKIKRYKLPEKLPLYFSEKEFERLLETIDNDDIKDLVIFAVKTGLRQMEILTLLKSQVILENRTIILDNQNHITKSKKIRTIPLSNDAFLIIQKRMNLYKSELLFTLGEDPIKQDYISKQFKKYVMAAKVNPRLHFHSLRHSFITWLLKKGASIYNVSKLAGHENLSTTEIYSHLISEDLRSTTELLDKN